MKIFTEGWQDYELIDVGNHEKLERFGTIITIRPEVQAYFSSQLPKSEWEKLAHFRFKETSKNKGVWTPLKNVPTNLSWKISFEKIQLKLALTQFKHVGVFPEQAINWKYITKHLPAGGKFLNLFAYTGAASLVANAGGGNVTHVDAVKQLVNWSKENMELSQLSDIRWIIEDALKFAQKEVKRGNLYDGIIMDPPAFGFGAKGERWILDKKIAELLEVASHLLNKNGFLIVNTYSPKLDLNELRTLANTYFEKDHKEIAELWMKSATNKELYYGNLLRIKRS